MCHQDFTPCLSTADVVRQYCRSYTPFYLLDRPDDGAGSKLGIMVNSPGFPCLAESLYKSPKSFSYTSFPHWNIFTRPALYSLYSAQNGYTYSTMTLRSSHLQRLSCLLLPRPRCWMEPKMSEMFQRCWRPPLPLSPTRYLINVLSLGFPLVGQCILCPWHPARHCTYIRTKVLF